jgi:uncharacterized protein YjbJ (UPF0337 family)
MMHNHQEAAMNWDQIEGKWKQSVGQVKEKWGKLTDDDLTVIRGKRDQLVGKIQERYGVVREDAEHQVRDFERTFRGADTDEVITHDDGEVEEVTTERRSGPSGKSTTKTRRTVKP